MLVVRRTVGRSLIVPAIVNSIPVKATIDTAAMITLVSSSLIKDIPEHTETVLLKGIGPNPISGKLVPNTAIGIGHTKIEWDVCVIDMTDTIILGLDFLNACSAVVDLQDMSVSINGEPVPAQLVEGSNQSLSDVLLTKTVKVPPNSNMLLTVEVKSPPEGDYVIVPVRSKCPALISNVIGTGSQCILNIINDSGRHVKIEKGTCVGYAEPVDEIFEEILPGEDTFDIRQVQLSKNRPGNDHNGTLPSHLQDLYEHSIANLNEDLRSTLRTLLKDFVDVS